MCLEQLSKPLKAEKDIECYKYIVEVAETILIDGERIIYKEGDSDGVECVVTVEDNQTYLCSNSEKLHGADCQDKKGFKFSYYVDRFSDHDRYIRNGKVIKPIKCLTTIYRGFKVKIGKTYRAKIIVRDENAYEGLHSYVSIPYSIGDAIKVLCVIPKDSTYYEGFFQGVPGYVSNKLKYVKIID